jgi:hypothetical protein
MMKHVAILTLCAAAASGQTITDVTPKPTPPQEPAPVYEVALDRAQAAAVYGQLVPLLHVPDGGAVPVQDIEVTVEHGPDGAPISARVMLGLTLDGQTLSSVRSALGLAWGLPADAKVRPISRVDAVVTNTGSAKVILQFK